MTRFLIALTLPVALTLSACSGGGGDSMTPPQPTVAPPSAQLNAQPCLDQPIGPGRPSVANFVVPDTIKVDLSQPSGFPNGRRLTDSVIDTELAWLFIDLTKHPATVLASRPLGPQANDVPFRSEFPYLAAPQGVTVPTNPQGSNFNFRTEPFSAYVQVDRMGMPAVATALIGSSQKNPYNDVGPPADSAGQFRAEETALLTGLFNAIGDDLERLGLKLCARKV